MDYRVIASNTARKLRVRVGLNGVEVVRPAAKSDGEVEAFLLANEKWIVGQIERVGRFRAVRKPRRKSASEILYRGEPTPVRVEEVAQRQGANQVVFADGCIVITRGFRSNTPPAKSLENWLRKQARKEIEKRLNVVCDKLNRSPGKIYVRGQRTKWGNCSALRNLSFNWRIILAPDFVFRYLITHEAVHLAVPDHSQKFWLTVRSLCPEMEKARQWLSANSHQLLVDLNRVCPE